MTKLALTHRDLGLFWLSGAKLRDLELQDWKKAELG